MIRAIVFDYGNVISDPQDVTCYSRMAAITGLTEEYFRSSFWKYRPDFDRGTIRGTQMYRSLLEESGLDGTEETLEAMAEKLLAEDMTSWSRVSQTVTGWALSLQAQGYKIGIMSNMPFDFLEYFGDSIELFKKADFSVFSCNERQIKPEEAIYRTLISRMDCAPEEIVFFDDIQANVDGALKSGIRAYLWTSLERAQEDLAHIFVQKT